MKCHYRAYHIAGLLLFITSELLLWVHLHTFTLLPLEANPDFFIVSPAIIWQLRWVPALLLPLWYLIILKWYVTEYRETPRARLWPVLGSVSLCIPVLYTQLITVSWLRVNLPVLIHLTVFIMAFSFWLTKKPGNSLRRRDAVLTFGFATLIYMLCGLYFTTSIGAHSGDEGHYLIQAESLYEDHDVDIYNNLTNAFGTAAVQQAGRQHFHVSHRSHEPHWYSYHAPGLPALLFPAEALGIAGRHAGLGLIAGAGLCAMLLLMRDLQVRRRLAFALIMMHGCSVIWVVYASRYLPEILGASLVLWALWSILVIRRLPIAAVCIAAVSVSLLPWVHIRFLPLALTLIGIFSIECMRIYGWPFLRRRVWLGFMILSGLGLGLYMLGKQTMFAGGYAHDIDQIFMTYPLGIWAALAGHRGLGWVFPVIFALLTLNIIAALTMRKQRTGWLAQYSLLLFLAALLTASSNRLYTGGAALPGRFLIVVAGTLVPAAAGILQQRRQRGHIILLALYAWSCLLTLLLLLHLSSLNKGFANLLPSLAAVQPILYGLFNPLPVFILSETTGMMILTASTFALLLAALTAASCYGKRHLSRWLLVATLIVAAAGHVVVMHHPGLPEFRRPLAHRHKAGRMLAALPLATSMAPLKLNPSPQLIYDTAIVSERSGLLIVNAASGSADHSDMIALHRIPANDWRNRDLNWATLLKPFDPGRNYYALYLTGTAHAVSNGTIAVQQGGETIIEQPLTEGEFEHELLFQTTENSGHVYILLRFDGEGQIRLDTISLSPYHKRLKKSGIMLRH